MKKRKFLSILSSCHNFFYNVFIALLMVQLSYAKEPIPINVHIDNYFNSLDSLLHGITNSKEVRSKKAVEVNEYFAKIQQENPDLINLSRISSKGVILNEVIDGKVKKRKNRNIRRQKWFRAISKNRKPYNGNFKQGKDNYSLFWARARTYKKKGGKSVFTGAITAEFDLKKCLEYISEGFNVSFTLYSEDKEIFSNLDTTASGELLKKEARIPGLEKVMVRFFKPVRLPDQDSLAREKAKAAALERQKKEEEIKKNRVIMEKNALLFWGGVAAVIGIPVIIIILSMLITKINRSIIQNRINRETL